MCIELIWELGAYKRIFNSQSTDEHLLFNSNRQIEMLVNALMRINFLAGI